MSKKQHSKKTSRIALLSDTERKYLKNENSVFSEEPEINKVIKSRFYRELDNRFEQLFKDLEVIQRSKKLRIWKSYKIRFNMYLQNVNYFQNLFSDVFTLYVNGIRRKRISNGKYKYWQDNSPLNDSRIDERAINSEHLFRRIKNLDESSKQILLKAFKIQGILPTTKEDAITLKEIQDRLSGKSKIRSNVKTVSYEEVIKDNPRNKEIIKIQRKYWRILNKKLIPYDSKVIQLWLDLHS